MKNRTIFLAVDFVLQSLEVDGLFSRLIDRLQASVDPFDLDVFTPHMQKHVASQRSRSVVSGPFIAESLTTSFSYRKSE